MNRYTIWCDNDFNLLLLCVIQIHEPFFKTFDNLNLDMVIPPLNPNHSKQVYTQSQWFLNLLPNQAWAARQQIQEALTSD